ncbi:MAG TPA: hypothetical protein VG326_06010 [Tepidisphaeraceae bacterium]|jgi:urease accessory protein UreE|nr:hypothetical protein [Tepidisphaeraceae bacterium]
MWCDRIIRQAHDAEMQRPLDRDVDFVDLEWNQAGPALKARSRGGQEIRIVLGAGGRIRHGDVIFEDGARVVAVNVRPCEVIVGRPIDGAAAALAALQLGNLHWPTQLSAGEIVFREGAVALAILDELKIPWSKAVRRFQPTEVIAAPSARLSPAFQVIRGGAGPRETSSFNSISNA